MNAPPHLFLPPVHGGDLAAAQRAYPAAPTPWIDLSTGINPTAYLFPPIPAEVFRALPDQGIYAAMDRAARSAYEIAPGWSLIGSAGTQPVLTALAGLRPPGRVAVVAPTYGEHARVWRANGHAVTDIAAPTADVDVLVVVNPNNPDGRRHDPAQLRDLAVRLAAKGGWLIVDEAFADLDPTLSVLSSAPDDGLIVLRSIGKFFGLAGMRLSFLAATSTLAATIVAALGPWPVSGPAAWIGARALGDHTWQAATRTDLARQSQRLDALLNQAGLTVAGGTSLFRLIVDDRVPALFDGLARHGIYGRIFAHDARWLRLGLPPQDGWERLAKALADFR